MDIAVVTGASSGLGEQFVKNISKLYSNIDEIWIIARRRERLEALSKKSKIKCRIVECDLTKADDIVAYANLLTQNSANVKILVNNAGFGKLGMFSEIPCSSNCGMIDLNCRAVTEMTQITLPFMKEHAFIINVCSIAAFVPNTRLTVYSSTKAYIMSFSKALRKELKAQKINVLALCPGPMDTEFLAVADIPPGESRVFDLLPRVNPDKASYGALIAARRGRGIYTPHPFFKFYRVMAKFIPHGIMMKLAGA